MKFEDLPQQLETMDDYQKVCLGFVVPFLHERAGEIANVIKLLHNDIDQGDLSQEQIEDYLNRIRSLIAFASPDNPMNQYFKNVIELERKLEENGEFNEEL